MTNDATHKCVGIWLTSKTCYPLGPSRDRIILWTLENWRMLICLRVARTFHLHHCSEQKTDRRDAAMLHGPINLRCAIFNDILPIRNGWTMSSMGIRTQAWAISTKAWNGALLKGVSRDMSTQGQILGLSAHRHIVYLHQTMHFESGESIVSIMKRKSLHTRNTSFDVDYVAAWIQPREGSSGSTATSDGIS